MSSISSRDVHMRTTKDLDLIQIVYEALIFTLTFGAGKHQNGAYAHLKQFNL